MTQKAQLQEVELERTSKQLNVFTDEDIDSAAEALNDVCIIALLCASFF